MCGESALTCGWCGLHENTRPACAETPAPVAACHFRAVEASALYDLSYV
jgi:hypothetical protein